MPFVQFLPDARDLLPVQPIDLPQLHGPAWALQPKDRFALLAHHMHMRRSVVIGVDDDPVTVESINGWHCIYPKRFG